jgi:hypothetical protein
MSKYGDMVALLDWAMKQKKEPEKKSRTKPEKPVDVFELLQQKRREAQMLEAFIKDMEKVNKKEEKKEDKSKLSTVQIAMLLIGTFPITGPLYVFWVQKLLGH